MFTQRKVDNHDCIISNQGKSLSLGQTVVKKSLNICENELYEIYFVPLSLYCDELCAKQLALGVFLYINR